MTPSGVVFSSLVRRIACAALIGAAVGACDQPLRAGGDGLPPLKLELFEVSEQYVIWWAELEECAGTRRDIGTQQFFKVTAPLDGPQFPCFEPGRWCNGLWAPPDSILLSAELLNNVRTVKHEMLHGLLHSSVHTEAFPRCTH